MTNDPGFEARQIIRTARVATLATQAQGQPFAALVTPATAPDLSVLLWLSTLSEHTRELAREPRCALLFTGETTERNPQTAPRVTVTGLAERIEDAALKGRWLSRHPYAALYAEFSDFALWRVAPRSALLVGGFARATRLRESELRPDHAAVAAAEVEILQHVNTDHADAMAAIAGALGGAPGDWRLVAVDTEGCDLALGEEVRRLPFAAPATTPDRVRAELIRAARQARS